MFGFSLELRPGKSSATYLTTTCQRPLCTCRTSQPPNEQALTHSRLHTASSVYFPRPFLLHHISHLFQTIHQSSCCGQSEIAGQNFGSFEYLQPETFNGTLELHLMISYFCSEAQQNSLFRIRFLGRERKTATSHNCHPWQHF